MNATPRKSGCSVLSDVPLREVLARNQGDEIVRFGKPREDAVELVVLLLDGTWSTLSCLEDEVDRVSRRLWHCWRRCILLDLQNVEVNRAKGFGTPQQHAKIMATLLKQAGNPPIGVLFARPFGVGRQAA